MFETLRVFGTVISTDVWKSCLQNTCDEVDVFHSEVLGFELRKARQANIPVVVRGQVVRDASENQPLAINATAIETQTTCAGEAVLFLEEFLRTT
jgi:hypothetical protein